MAVKAFKFASPGIFLNEVDQSQIPTTTAPVGPIIIGRAQRGPAMRPVTVASFDEFVQTFGEPVAGGDSTGDVWRSGVPAGPTYGGYAAQAWLANNPTVTYVRLLGAQSENATGTTNNSGKAGWTYGGTPNSVTTVGTYGLYVFPNQSSIGTTASLLASAVGSVSASAGVVDGDVLKITLPSGYAGLTSSVDYTITITSSIVSPTASANNLYISSAATNLVPPTLHQIIAAGIGGAGNVAGISVSNTSSIGSGFALLYQYINATSADGVNLFANFSGVPGNSISVSGSSNKIKKTAGPTAFTAGTNATLTSYTGSLAAIWYCSGSVPVLSGTAMGTSTTTAANSAFINSDAFGGFTVKMSSSSGLTAGVGGTSTKTFNFNPTSGQFIRKVFNTNPQSVNQDTNTGLDPNGSSYYAYWLGETFENDIAPNIGVSDVTGSLSGIIVPLRYVNERFLPTTIAEDYAARTGWIIGQGDPGTDPAYSTATAAKLFRFVALDPGDWIRNNLKVTIANIRPPQNDAQKFATFDVEIRRVNDTDANKKIVESYTDCDLDDSSPNFIGRKIGDEIYSWDETNRVVYKKSGDYVNNSKFIRVEMASGYQNTKIPFGVLGPMKYVDKTASTITLSQASGIQLGWGLAYSSNVIYGSYPDVSYKLVFPSLRQRVSSSEDSLTTYTLADFGAATTRNVSSLLYNDGVNDLLRLPAVGTSEFTNGVPTTNLQYAWTFSLDEIVQTGSGASTAYYYLSGSKAAGTSFTCTSSSIDLLNNSVNSFTTVFQGGTDGFNVIEGEPLRNTAMGSTPTNDTSYVYYTYRRAIDTIRDPESVEGNLIVIPGLTHETLTGYELQIAEQRGDVLAVIDASGDSVSQASYVTKYEVSDYRQGTNDRVSTVDQVVSQIKSRNLNSSYGATYYPWVQISDSTSGKILPVPPSIPALGAMSYTDLVQAPWFAPAGFNRGGLSTGNAGLNVVNVLKKLSSADRDKLYPVNINPIASFPNEGIVIFGQKTLQAVPSALDRINVRRLMLYIKRGINTISTSILFEPNVENTWNNFKDKAEPFLADVKARFGLDDYKLILDKTTTTPDLIDQNILYAKIFLKPTRTIEFIAIDFFITRSGANFNG